MVRPVGTPSLGHRGHLAPQGQAFPTPPPHPPPGLHSEARQEVTGWGLGSGHQPLLKGSKESTAQVSGKATGRRRIGTVCPLPLPGALMSPGQHPGPPQQLLAGLKAGKG